MGNVKNMRPQNVPLGIPYESIQSQLAQFFDGLLRHVFATTITASTTHFNHGNNKERREAL
ncbi:hypothetical protein LOAG_11236 [Loa loa]|uniref:Uncharacterized protein n=1 Tax=Loa loa TaxID=7209 RepID=A0A1S0TNW0_LOALO|nr:hypothetical protein LOAG_11236 [Loa loa]EFO17263.1 hypothetical protein LOAG_11236 [Loa loa]